MQWKYHDLVGKRVITADGHCVGRVADLHAARRGEALRVTSLLVGETQLIRRIGFRHLFSAQDTPPYPVPWRSVERISDHIQLRVTQARLREEAQHAQDMAGGE